MNNEHDVPALTPEAKAFLEGHAATGEPTAEALQRVQRRLADGQAGRAMASPPPARRPWFPSTEVLAVAAVLAAAVAVSAVYSRLRTDDAEQAAQVEAARSAYRAGDLDGAVRLASQQCTGEACRSLQAALQRLQSLSVRSEALTPAERQQWATLDAEVSDGQPSVLTAKGLEPKPVPPATASDLDALVEKVKAPRPAPASAAIRVDDLLERTRQLLKAGKPREAADTAQACLAAMPDEPTCLVLLGSAWARVGTENNDPEALEKGRAAYQRYVEVAPADDSNLRNVKALLQVYERSQGDTDEDQGTPSAGAPSRRVVVDVGAEVTVALDTGLSRVAVGDSSVADLSVPGGNALVVKGVAPGATTVLVWLKDGTQRRYDVTVR